jgi:hypothetical protein
MPSISWIISVSILLISFLGIVFTAKFLAKPVDKYEVSFMRMFPFEMARTAENNGKFYSFSSYLFAGMCFSPIIVIMETTTKLANLYPVSILISCALGLAGLCFVFINIFDVTHVKPHLVLFGIFGSLTLLSSLLVATRGFVAFDIYRKHGITEALFIIAASVSALISLFVLFIIMNPKLKAWARLDQVDGEYVRPKRFVLAYSEWAILLALFLTEMTYFLQLVVK